MYLSGNGLINITYFILKSKQLQRSMAVENYQNFDRL